MSDQITTAAELDALRHLAELIERTKDLDFDPSINDGEWICGPHGLPECAQDGCASLPWPVPNSDPILGAFTEWACGEFLREVRPYDEGRVPEMPDEALRSYSVWEWPIGAIVESGVLHRPDQPQRVQLSREDVLLAIGSGWREDFDEGGKYGPIFESRFAVDAVLALFAEQPTVAEVRAQGGVAALDVAGREARKLLEQIYGDQEFAPVQVMLDAYDVILEQAANVIGKPLRAEQEAKR